MPVLDPETLPERHAGHNGQPGRALQQDVGQHTRHHCKSDDLDSWYVNMVLISCLIFLFIDGLDLYENRLCLYSTHITWIETCDPIENYVIRVKKV